MKQALTICLIVFAMSAATRAQLTNSYHFGRTFAPVTYTSGSPTTYRVIMGAKALTGIVGPTNIFVRSNETYATEYEGFAWGYESANAAWTSAFAIYPNYSTNYPGMTYDNAGWIKGTRQAYGDWGSFIWLLQNTISFTSSASSVYVSPGGVTSTIASVLVGTLGDYCPQTFATETGPVFTTNYPGTGTGTDEVFRADLNAYYKLVPFSYLGVNNDDSDEDGIPDFADGYNLTATNSADDVSTNDFFTIWPLQLSSNASPTQALISITYAASDPANISQTTNGYAADTNGYFRLWSKQGFKARNKAAITNGGDYIPSGTYPATALGFNATNRIVEVYIEPVNPITNREIVIQVDPDGTNATKGFVCQDKLAATLIAAEFITPAGNPVTAPTNSGIGQNEFTFSTNYPGVVIIDLKALIRPSGVASNIRDSARFVLSPIGGSALSWHVANPGGKPVVSGNYFVATAIFTGLPTNNIDFGSKTAALLVANSPIEYQTFEVFFAKWATNYPNATTNFPNWFYYWRDGQVCGIDTNCVYDPSAYFGYTLPGADTLVRLGPLAPDANTGPEFYSSGGTNYGTLTVTGQGKGIQCVAETIQHERHHLEIYSNFNARILAAHAYGGPYNGDPDDDPDDETIPTIEEATFDGVRSDSTNADTFLMGGTYSGYGDNEIRCRNIELSLTIAIHTNADWADPGCQSMNKFGP